MSSIDTPWRKATASGNGGDCVEVKFTADSVLIRDSKYRRDPANNPATEPVITVPASSWQQFLTEVVSGEPCQNDQQIPRIERDTEGNAILRSSDGTTLQYTAREWSAFTDGVLCGEFEKQLVAM